MQKIFTIEYYNYASGNWEKRQVEDVFVLAIIPKAYIKDREDLCGLNVCVVIAEDPHRNDGYDGRKIKEALDEHFNKRIHGIFNIYLLGENGIKIPLDIHGGNGWSTQYYDGLNTCCYFGYVHPLMFGSIKNGRNYVT